MRLTQNNIAVSKIIYAKPGATRADVRHLNQALDSLIRRELIAETNGVLSLSPELQDYIGSIMPKGEIAQPRTINRLSGTLSAKYIPNPWGRREGCDRREVSFTALSSNVQPTKFYGVPNE